MNFPMWIIWVVVGLIAFECLCHLIFWIEQLKYRREDKNG